MLGRDAGLIVCMPHPLQFSGMRERDPERSQRLALDSFGSNREDAFHRLRTYSGAVGFKRISNRDLRFAMSAHGRLPSLEEPCPML